MEGVTFEASVSRSGGHGAGSRSPPPLTLAAPYPPRISPFTMYHDVDNDFLRAWQLLHELSEQNALNHKMSSNLHSLTDALKVTTFHYHTCFRPQ